MVITLKRKDYKKIVKKHLPKENRIINLVKAFFIGGTIGLLANFLLDFFSYKFHLTSADAGIVMMTTIIFFTCLLTAFGFFDNFVKFARMGAIIPITGFAHSMQSAALDYKNEGPIYGIGSNIFKMAGSVILYGVVSTIIFSLIRIIILGA